MSQTSCQQVPQWIPLWSFLHGVPNCEENEQAEEKSKKVELISPIEHLINAEK